MAALTVDFRKHSGPTPADDMAAQIITDCGNFTLDFKQHESVPLQSSSRLWDLVFKWPLFHTRHSSEMQEIFRGAHNNKRQYFFFTFSDKKCALQTQAFLTIVSVQSTRFISFNHSCRCFFAWQWQQVCNQISNLRLYYIDSGPQHHNKMILAPYVAESALVWMGSSPFVLLPASAVT